MRDQLPRRLRNPLSPRRAILLGIALIIAFYRYRAIPPDGAPSTDVSTKSSTRSTGAPPNAPRESCAEWRGCFTGVVSHIADGDTLDVRSAGSTRRVRLVLVDAPERDTTRGPASTRQLAALCPVNSPAAVYPDLRQERDEFGRTLGVVYCGGKNANAGMIRSGHAQLYRRFCRRSIFGEQDWARELGCLE